MNSTGTTWASGLTVWPSFSVPGLAPGNVLITFNDYSIAPGAIFYDVLDKGDAYELAAVAATTGLLAAEGIADLLVGMSTVGMAVKTVAVPTAGVLATEMEADVCGQIGMDTYMAAA